MTSAISIEALLLLDSEGERFYVKYYADKYANYELDEQRKLEKGLFGHYSETTKGQKPILENDIFAYKNITVIVRSYNDIKIFVIINQEENELIASELLTCLRDCIEEIIKTPKGKITIESLSSVDNFPKFLKIIDELIYEGAIITLEANEVINTLSTPGRTSFISPPKQANNQNNGAGSSFSQIFGIAKASLKDSLNFPG